MKKSRGKRIRLQASERLNRRVRDAGESSEVHIINFIIKFISATPLCGPQKKKKKKQEGKSNEKCVKMRMRLESAHPHQNIWHSFHYRNPRLSCPVEMFFGFFYTIFAAISFKISGRCKLGPQKLVTNWQVLSCCVGGGRVAFDPINL